MDISVNHSATLHSIDGNEGLETTKAVDGQYRLIMNFILSIHASTAGAGDIFMIMQPITSSVCQPVLSREPETRMKLLNPASQEIQAGERSSHNAIIHAQRVYGLSAHYLAYPL